MSTLQDRLLSNAPLIQVGRAKDLLKNIRGRLNRAFEEGRLSNRLDEINRHVRISPAPEGAKDTYAITGGIKDQNRNPKSARLKRDDGAWFHFTLTLREKKRDSFELLAYDFEIIFHPGAKPVFLRFDLNLPGHANDDREIRSHFHPGSDDLLAPAPVMTPIEILDLFLDGLRERNPEKPRS